MVWWSQSKMWPCALWGSKMDGGGGRRFEKIAACNCENMLLLWNDNVERRTKPKAEIELYTQKSTTLHSKTTLFLFKLVFAGQMTHANHHITDVHDEKHFFSIHQNYVCLFCSVLHLLETLPSQLCCFKWYYFHTPAQKQQHTSLSLPAILLSCWGGRVHSFCLLLFLTYMNCLHHFHLLFLLGCI